MTTYGAVPLLRGDGAECVGQSSNTSLEGLSELDPLASELSSAATRRRKWNWWVSPRNQRGALAVEEADTRSWRLIDRQAAFRQASGHIRVNRLNRSPTLYLGDLFHTLVGSPVRIVLSVAVLFYLVSILVFTGLYMLVSGPCELGLDTFGTAWAFSVETIMTIGYAFPGDKPYFSQCTGVIILVTIESILGCICDAVAVGLVYARFSRAQSRAETIVFSDFALFRRINGKLHFMFQVAEMRKHQLIEAHVRCYAISRHGRQQQLGGSPGSTRSVSDLVYFRTDAMRLTKPDDELGGMLFMALPNVVVHPVDSFSPLNPERGAAVGASNRHDPSTSYCFPDVLQRDCDVANGNREAKTVLAEENQQQNDGVFLNEGEDKISGYLKEHRVEIVVLLEGIEAITSDTIQARHSYCVNDILWHHDFAPCTQEGENGEAQLDFNLFHKVFPVPKEDRDKPPAYIIAQA